jgi:hypothetical protein
MKQKDRITVAGITVRTALLYEVNFREKSPVVAEVIEGNKIVKAGDILLCHHNLYYPPSPFFLQDDLYAVPFAKTLFAIVGDNGELRPICGNLICERVPVETLLPVPVEERKTHINRAKVIDPGNTPCEAGQLIFHRPNAGYDIVYNWQGIEKRVTKVHEDQVCGIW